MEEREFGFAPYSEVAPGFLRAGWLPLPLPKGRKFPPPEEFTGKGAPSPSMADVMAWSDDQKFGGGNTALRLQEHIVGVDVDAYNGKPGATSLSAMCRAADAGLPATVVLSSRSDGVSGIRLFRLPGWADPERMREDHRRFPGVDLIRAGHRYVLAPGSLHPEGGVYVARDERTGSVSLTMPPIDELPVLPDEWVTLLTPVVEESEAPGEPWSGAPADDAAREWATGLLVERARAVAATGKGGRHQAANDAALLVGHYAPHAIDPDVVVATLMEACVRNGYVADDGEKAARTAIARGLVKGMEDPREPGGLRDASGVLGAPPVEVGEARGGVGPFIDPDRALAAGYDDLDVDTRREAWRLAARKRAQEFMGRYEALANPAPPFDAALAENLPDAPTEWLVGGLLPRDGRMLVVAQRKTGKTTFALNLALALSTGVDFLGRFPVKHLGRGRRIALLNYEVSGGTIKVWASEMGMPTGRLFVVNVRGRRNPLAHAEDRQELAALLRAQGIEVLIVDPFGRAFSGESQNDAGLVGAWLADLDRFAGEVGAREVVLVAHAGWGSVGRSRGSSALEDWPDSIVRLTREGQGGDDDEDDEDDATLGTRYMSAEGRDVNVAEDALVLDPATRRLRMAGTGNKRQARKSRHLMGVQNGILRALAAEDGLNTRELEDALAAMHVAHQRGDVSAALPGLVSQGFVERRPGARGAVLNHLTAAARKRVEESE